jgi:hypothetical protein
MNGRTRVVIFVCFLAVACGKGFPQVLVSGVVKDAATKNALPYCSISVKGSTKGTLTNDEGAFSIRVNTLADTIIFNYLGYKKKGIPASAMAQKKILYLERKEIVLNEFIVHVDDDYLFDIIEKCRKMLLRNQGNQTARLYYGIETQSKGIPVELVECYYNAYMNGISIDSLLLKNGRLGLAELDKRYFLTLNSSRAISNIDVIRKSDQYPAIPFQYSKRNVLRKFILKLAYVDENTYNIKFTPLVEDHTCFFGDAWIDKNTFALLKIHLTIEDAAIHPFLPLFSNDSISHVRISLSQTFNQINNNLYLDHINFIYNFKYKSAREAPMTLTPSIITRDITTKGLLYFYDYETPFILPYFWYDASFDDYRKMSIIPYNEDFWDNNYTLILTEAQKKDLGYFSNTGHLINFKKGNFGKNFLNISYTDSSVFEYYYSFWTPGDRIILNRKLSQNNIFTVPQINSSIPGELYKLVVQILLDMNETDSGYLFKSYTVFDAKNTFYHLPELTYTKAFLNIYFDICEVERRKLEKKLIEKKWTLEQIESLYYGTLENTAIITRKYLKEVQNGKEEKALKKWNHYIIEQLGIDNISICNPSN